MARRRHGPMINSGNHPGNPLRAYRMGMLQHGFVDESDRPGMKPDEQNPMSYGVVGLRNARFPVVAVISILGIVAAVAVVAAVIS
jgi:hypothetical protein